MTREAVTVENPLLIEFCERHQCPMVRVVREDQLYACGNWEPGCSTMGRPLGLAGRVPPCPQCGDPRMPTAVAQIIVMFCPECVGDVVHYEEHTVLDFFSAG